MEDKRPLFEFINQYKLDRQFDLLPRITIHWDYSGNLLFIQIAWLWISLEIN